MLQGLLCRKFVLQQRSYERLAFLEDLCKFNMKVYKDSWQLTGEVLHLRREIKKLCKHKQIWQCSETVQTKIADMESRIFKIAQEFKKRRKESNKSNQHKRRGLERNSPFNEPFRGSDEHHLDKQTVINIPSKLHKSISHSLKNSESMERINKAALLWFTTKDKRRASNMFTTNE